MTDNLDSLLSRLQEEVDNGKRLGRLRMVDPQVMQDVLESSRAAVPVVVERAKEVVAGRDRILEDTRREADAKLSNAQHKADELEAHTNERVQEVISHAKERVVQSRAQGEQIIAQAQEQAAQMVEEHNITAAAQEHSDAMLRQARAAAEEIESNSRQRAEEMIAKAQAYAHDLRQRTEQWGVQYTKSVSGVVEEIVNEAEDILSGSLTEIRATKKRLQVTLNKSANTPAVQTPTLPEF